MYTHTHTHIHMHTHTHTNMYIYRFGVLLGARYKLSRSYHLCACIALVNCILQILSLFSVRTCIFTLFSMRTCAHASA